MATNEEHYQELLKKFRDIRKVFPGVYLLIWDWEYNTPGNSCFCPTCKETFRKFADVADAAQLSDEELVTKYPRQWKRFRMDQSVRHATHVIKLFRKIGVEITVYPWHFERSEFETQHLKGIMKEGYISWPGGLPPDRNVRGYMPGLRWAERMPGTKVKGQIIVSWYPKAVLDERRYKAYTITMAIGTHGGGYEYWNRELFEPGSAGMRYFVGEATRMIADFDEFYLRDGNYTRDGFSSNLDTIDFYVIQRLDKRRALVFAYNDNAKPKAATIVCKHPGALVRLWPSDEWMKGESYYVTIPPVDVLALEYRY